MKYLVWCPFRGQTKEDALTIFAKNWKEAAEIWGEQSCSLYLDYSIISENKTIRINVQGTGLDGVHVFDVTGECIPVFHAKEVK
jgi:hypothetical protein